MTDLTSDGLAPDGLPVDPALVAEMASLPEDAATELHAALAEEIEAANKAYYEADAPILTLALTSMTLPLSKVEDLADTRLAQKISQVTGVGLVSINVAIEPGSDARTKLPGSTRRMPIRPSLGAAMTV